MRAVTYSRKSTQSEKGVSGDSLSIERQRELARDFATKRGWEVVADYADDAISGADFINRDGLARMLAAAQQTPRPFDVIVCMDESRIGRDQYRTAYVLQQVADAGLQLWFYQDARQAQLDSAVGKFMESVRSFGSELEREKAKARTREALRQNAKDGHVPSGRAYGYTNVRDGAHVKRVIKEPEARVVRRIFELTSEGLGLHRIVRLLNDEQVPAPWRDGWAPSTIKAMLQRPLYRGQVVYGQTRRVDRGGRQRKAAVPQAEWLVREAPELRIVPESLWRAAHARLEKTRQVYDGVRTRGGTLRGRPESGLVSRHLLAGFLQCGRCGGTLFVSPSRSQGPRGKVVLYYRCTTHHKWGNARCTNKWGVPYGGITEAILGNFRERFLNPAFLEKSLREEWERHQNAPDDRQARLAALHEDVDKLDSELTRLAEAIALGGEIPQLVQRMTLTRQRRDEVAAHVEHLEGQAVEQEDFDLPRWLHSMVERALDIQATLEANSRIGRHLLRGLLATPITMTPELREGRLVDWAYSGVGTLDQLLSGKLSDPVKIPKAVDMHLYVPPELFELTVKKVDTTAYQPAR